MIGRLRLYSGLVLFLYVAGHLINHMGGIVSLETMNAWNRPLAWPWRTWPGTALLLGSLIVHVVLSLYALYERRRLTMKSWEVVQLVLGLVIPLMLAFHVIGTRVIDEISGGRIDYTVVMLFFWVFAPINGIQQAVALIVVWVHSCIGLHMWLRLMPWYNRVRWLAISLAVSIPALSLAGYIAAGVEVQALAQIEGYIDAAIAATGRSAEQIALAEELALQTQIGVVVTLLLIFGARFLREQLARRRPGPVLRYAPGDREIPILEGSSVLETIRAAGIRHASVCGGRGRCSTCRVRIGAGREQLVPPDENEQKVLARLGLDHGDVRLACQLRPTANTTVTALLPHEDSENTGGVGNAQQKGDEVEVACLFVDLRGSTKLSEDRLPFDVVFILNQFFAELSSALEETNGHYAQFNGDGLMALYGLQGSPDSACRDALAGAAAMVRRIDALSARLAGELQEPLRIGIGIHFGEAIVGSMGPPHSPIVSALGDNINIAARLESMTKDLGVTFCVSARTLEIAGINIAGMEIHALPVKGRERPVRVIGFKDLTSVVPASA